MYVYMYVYIYIHTYDIYIYIHVYIYIYIYRERERDRYDIPYRDFQIGSGQTGSSQKGCEFPTFCHSLC